MAFAGQEVNTVEQVYMGKPRVIRCPACSQHHEIDKTFKGEKDCPRCNLRLRIKGLYEIA